MSSCSPGRSYTSLQDFPTQPVGLCVVLYYFVLFSSILRILAYKVQQFRTSRAVHVIDIISLYALYIRILDTLNVGDGEASKDTSVHLTVGVDTHIWGLNFASLRDSSFKRSGLNDKVLLTKLDDSLYWELQVTHSLFVCCIYLYMGEINH